MPSKHLTQTGLNRAMWFMLKSLGGKVTIPEAAVEKPNPDDAMLIQYDPSIKSFAFSLHKVKEPKQSLIIQPGMN